ncbi:uncharacterized protein [Ptychodera flava]|uniref:uncharacterized protein n=1 Tax=Ptychodera flava TaxID=63121 RepID=UPI003969D238
MTSRAKSSASPRRQQCLKTRADSTSHLWDRETIATMRRQRETPLITAERYIKLKRDRVDWFDMKQTENKGRGVFAAVDIDAGEFLLEYAGEIISEEEGEKREETIPSVYRNFFKHNSKTFCIDATTEPSEGPQYGRLVNHGDHSHELNSKMRIVVCESVPHLCLFSIKAIAAGTEILYNYGIKDLPWKKPKNKDCVQLSKSKDVAAKDNITGDPSLISYCQEPQQAYQPELQVLHDQLGSDRESTTAGNQEPELVSHDQLGSDRESTTAGNQEPELVSHDQLGSESTTTGNQEPELVLQDLLGNFAPVCADVDQESYASDSYCSVLGEMPRHAINFQAMNELLSSTDGLTSMPISQPLSPEYTSVDVKHDSDPDYEPHDEELSENDMFPALNAVR